MLPSFFEKCLNKRGNCFYNNTNKKTNDLCKHYGYNFCWDDYIKLKMLNFMVHKDAVTDLLEKCTEEK